MPLFSLCLLLGSWSFKKAPLQINFQLLFGPKPLVLDTARYVSAAGDTLTIETFRFYVSNFCFYKNGRSYAVKNSYYLVDAARPSSQQMQLSTVLPPYDSLALTIGVDSVASVSGALGGALDPAAGMYWAWNTGYINAKLEGHCNRCNTLHHAFEFHIGGYRSPYAAARRVTLKPKASGGITIEADAARLLDNIALKETNSIMIPGKEACIMADKCSTLFKIKS